MHYFFRILIAAEKLNCLEEALTVVAFISSEDVFLPLPSSLKEEEKYTRKFDTNEGDHIKFLNIFRAYKSAKNSLKHQELKVGYSIREIAIGEGSFGRGDHEKMS